MLLNAFRSLFSNSQNRKARRASDSARLQLIRLEQRIVPLTFSVINNLDSGAGSLRQAIDDANNETANPGADIINFAPTLVSNGSSTINLSTSGDSTAGPSAFGITSTISINGPTGNNGITLNNTFVNQRLFYISAAGSLTLNSLTLSGGKAQGGNGGNGSGGGGGGAAGLGGAVFNQGSLTILNSTFSGNQAIGGTGGMGGSGGNGGGGAGLSTSGNIGVVGGNTGGGGGGPNGGSGGFAAGGTFGGFGGGSGGGNGGPNSGQAGNPGFGGGTGTGNSGGAGAGFGGAIFNNVGTVTISNSTFSTNTAQGGIGANGGPMAVVEPSSLAMARSP